MPRPLVGLTWGTDIVGRSSSPGENLLRYLDLLVRSGADPVLLTPGTSTQLLDRIDGLLVPGGPDITPAAYGQQPGPHLGATSPELDELEMAAITAARERAVPILGICRGQQMVNVALGGTLLQHVDGHPTWSGDPSAPAHEVAIEPGTYLREAIGANSLTVNSGHHQAVDRVAPSLRVAARSADGHIEALEAPELHVLAVQWHPEEMPDDPSTSGLLAAFRRWLPG